MTDDQKNNLKRYCFFKKSFEKKSTIINNFIEEKNILKQKKVFNNKIIFVGRYSKLKGFEDLIELVKETKGVNFSLIGDNNFKSKLSNLKNLGKINNSKMFKEYDNHSILILPSYTEAFPMVILEAMSRGLVILVSDIPGMREIIQEGKNGYLFNSGDIKRMRDLILYLKNNPLEIKKISKNNLKDVRKFILKRQLPKYLRVYEESLN